MSGSSLMQRRILVVDDEPLVCGALKMMLTFDGHKVETANNGHDALKLYDSNQFDLVITDFKMPEMQGDQLAATLKARNPKQPVVMITAYYELLASTGGAPPGVDLLISKPFMLENLRAAIAKVIPPSRGTPA